MASMKPRQSANCSGQALVAVVELIELLQLLQPKQETSHFLLWFAMPLHHVGFVLQTCTSLVLLLFIGGYQNIHARKISLSKCKKTMPWAWCGWRAISLLLPILQSRSWWGLRLNIVGLSFSISWFSPFAFIILALSCLSFLSLFLSSGNIRNPHSSMKYRSS